MTKVSFIQTDIAWNDASLNVSNLRPQVRAAVEQGSNLIVLPEMFTTGFSFSLGREAQEACSRGLDLLSEVAANSNATLIGSLPEISEEAERPFNTTYVVDRSGVRAKYRKMHLFTFGGENGAYAAGTDPLTLEISGLRVTLAICYDLRFGMYFYERAPVTDLFVIVANWPAPRQVHWDTLLRARAIENQAFVLGVNRIGEGGGLQYSGGSCLIAPTGDYVLQAANRPGVFSADIDPLVVKNLRTHFPVLADRRPLEVYQ